MADVDLQAKLRELLADPAALSSIMNLVSGLGLSQSSGQPTASQTAQTSQLDFTQPQQPQPNFAQPSNPLLNLGQLSETQPSISTNNIDSSSGVSSAAGTDNTVSSGDDSIPVFARQPNIPRLQVKVGARDQGCALLAALKHYLAPKRAEKIDTMIKLTQLTELTRGMLNARS